MRNGIFLAPFHPVDEDPTLALQRDLELIEHLDRLGYDEAWIGEHHSAGYEIIASPELFIAAAAERTRRIKLGTGVISLPYHNPLMAANRMIQLDHMTRGPRHVRRRARAAAVRRAHARHPRRTQRDRMVESIEVILRLFAGETRDAKTDWFTLGDARCQLRPYTWPHPEIAVASGHAVGRQARRQARLRHAVRGRDASRTATTRSASTGRSPTTSPPRTARKMDREDCASSGRCTSPRRASRRSRT